MSLKIYFDIMSPPARAVLLFCKLNKIAFTPQPIALRKLQQKSEEFTKVNPFQRVPAISDGDFNLSESMAILQYLAAKHNTSEHWLPSDLVKRARVHEFTNWYNEALRQYGMAIVLESAKLFVTKGQQPNPKKLEKLWKGINKGLDEVESYYLTDRPYIAGDQISIADLIGSCEIMHLVAQAEDFTSSRPKMTDWLKRVREETNPAFDEVHSIVYQLGEVKKPNF